MRASIRRVASLSVAAGLTLGVAAGGLTLTAESAQATVLPTDSAVTVLMDDVHPDAPAYLKGLKVTVSQTRNLVNQAIQVSWTGWHGTTTPLSGETGEYFLQVMQCWEPNPEGEALPPDPETCQFGTSTYTIGSRDTRDAVRGGVFDVVDFRSVNGTHINMDAGLAGRNEFWNGYTQNAMSAKSALDGSGSLTFEVHTGSEAPGLGCGERLTAEDGTVAGRPCWLVIVARGPNTGSEREPNSNGSPFSDGIWDWAIPIRTDFIPAGEACSSGQAETRIGGTELVREAALSWQRALCGGGAPFVYSQVGDPQARSQLTAGGTIAPAGALIVNAVDPVELGPRQGVDYAPVALSGLAIGYRIDVENGATKGSPINELRLTPRLLAKMLTMSYTSELGQAATGKYANGTFGFTPAAGYEWAERNADNLFKDPEFLALNPDLSGLLSGGRYNRLKLTLDHTDAAAALWAWIAADPTASAWMAGAPDQWGMRVNPYYSTTAATNPTGLPFELPRTDFPLADPWCDVYGSAFEAAFPGVTSGNATDGRTGLCGPDRVPYLSDWHDAARQTLVGTDPMKSTWSSTAIPPRWEAAERLRTGRQTGITVTDVASAARYGLDTAILCDGTGTACAAPTVEALTAATSAMTEQIAGSGVRQLVASNPLPAGAYPLTHLVYLAVPYGDLDLDGDEDRDPTLRGMLADYIEYAAGAGQTSGSSLGQLPPGYAPLPETLAAQARSTAEIIAARVYVPPPAPTPTTQTPVTSTPVVPGTTTTGFDPNAAGSPSVSSAGSTTPADPISSAAPIVAPGIALGGLAAALAAPLLRRWRPPTG